MILYSMFFNQAQVSSHASGTNRPVLFYKSIHVTKCMLGKSQFRALLAHPASALIDPHVVWGKFVPPNAKLRHSPLSIDSLVNKLKMDRITATPIPAQMIKLSVVKTERELVNEPCEHEAVNSHVTSFPLEVTIATGSVVIACPYPAGSVVDHLRVIQSYFRKEPLKVFARKVGYDKIWLSHLNHLSVWFRAANSFVAIGGPISMEYST